MQDKIKAKKIFLKCLKGIIRFSEAVIQFIVFALWHLHAIIDLNVLFQLPHQSHTQVIVLRRQPKNRLQSVLACYVANE